VSASDRLLIFREEVERLSTVGASDRVFREEVGCIEEAAPSGRGCSASRGGPLPIIEPWVVVKKRAPTGATSHT
jgi:hypothetical protein